MASKQYVPILKAREAEIVALRRRPGHLEVTPYFELQNMGAAAKDPVTGLPKRGKSAVTDASYFLDDIAGCGTTTCTWTFRGLRRRRTGSTGGS